jgi:hypothetical protein
LFLLGTTIGLGQVHSSGANPSRPSITNSPDLGPVGFVEIDVGAAGSWSRESSSLWTTPLLLKYTFAKQWEVRVGTDGIAFLTSPQGQWKAPQNVAWWLQWVPVEAGADDLHWALGAGTNMPFADGTTSMNAWNYTASLALAKTFSGISWQSNVVLGTTRVEGELIYVYGLTALLSRTLFERWVPFIDGCLNFQNAETIQPDHKIVVGTGYIITPQWVLDAAITVGLTQVTKGQTLQLGLSIIP